MKIKGHINIKKIFCVFVLYAVLSLFVVNCAVVAENKKTPEDLRNADIDEMIKLTKFDSRDYNIVTPVKDQGSSSLCWAYSTANASEISILLSGIDKNINVNVNTIRLSPRQIGYARHNRGTDPLGLTSGEITGIDDWQNNSGGIKYAAALLASWCGPVKDTTAYNADGWKNAEYKLKSAVLINGKNIHTDKNARDKMKRAIVKYGAVTFSYNNERNEYYFNPSGSSSGYPHACTVIGWDDTIPASSFKPKTPSSNGGWMIKNSYSDLPYLYLSYDINCEQIYAFDYAVKDEFDNNYFYDGLCEQNFIGSAFPAQKGANIFTAQSENEYVKGINVNILGEDAECTVKIYTDIDLKSGKFIPENYTLAESKTVKLDYGGYNYIEFENPVKVDKGKNFAVVAEVSGTGCAVGVGTDASDNSYLNRGSWTKSNVPPAIKAYTKIIKSSDNSSEENSALMLTEDNKVKVCLGNENSILVMAYYKGGILSDISIVPVDKKIDNTKYIIKDIPSNWKREKGAQAKAFLWEDSTLKPYCKEIDLFNIY